jgi:hypothetical protein
MSYAFTQDVPANAEMYAKIKALLPAHADGLIAHIAVERDGGLRYTDVWENEAAWIAFRDNHVEPAVGEVLAGYGLPHSHDLVVFNELELVDAWLG